MKKASLSLKSIYLVIYFEAGTPLWGDVKRLFPNLWLGFSEFNRPLLLLPPPLQYPSC